MPQVTTDGTVTIPRETREELGIEPGDEVVFTRTETGWVVEKRAPTTADGTDPFERYRGVASGDGTTEETMSRLRGEYPRSGDADDGETAEERP